LNDELLVLKTHSPKSLEQHENLTIKLKTKEAFKIHHL